VSRPRPAADFLAGILKTAGSSASRAEFRRALERVLDDSQREHCHVAGFRAGKLVVEVDSAPLYAEFSGFRREELRLAINDHLQKQKVAQLVFRLGGTGHV